MTRLILIPTPEEFKGIFGEEAQVSDLYAEAEYSSYPAHRPVAAGDVMETAPAP